MAGSVAGALRPQKAAPTMPYSAQLAPTASAKRRFVELRFPVKKIDVGYTRENVNRVGIFGNGGPCKKQSKKQSVKAQLGHVSSHLQPTDSRSTVGSRAPRATVSDPFDLITLLIRSTGSFYHITYYFRSIFGAMVPPRDPCLCPSTAACTAEAVYAFCRALFTPFSPRLLQ